MKFIKDILFIETVATGPDPDKDPIIQLSASLLDKDNLLEKNFFNTYIRVSLLDSVIEKHAQILGIETEILRKSPKITDTLKKFQDIFGNDLIIATQNFQNILFLRQAFKKSLIPWNYDVHIIELWTLSYIYALSYGIKKIPTIYTLSDHFKIKLSNSGDALEKVRVETQIFKKLTSHA